MKQLLFIKKDPLEEIKNKKKEIFNFLNLHSLWLFKNNFLFRKEILKDQNLNFPDGTFIAWKLGIKKQRGPNFTKKILSSNFIKKRKLFFVGIEKEDLEEISNKFGLKINNIFSYNPPYIKTSEFLKEEKDKIVKNINKKNVDYVFVAIGNPKQEIFSNQIFDKIKVDKIFNIGAALDFILIKKKEAPFFVRKFGLEWSYRLFTDFKHSWKKVFRSLIALKYLRSVKKK